jgi:hypothetical protein
LEDEMARPRFTWCAIWLTLATTFAAPMTASAAGTPGADGKLPALGVDAGPSGVVVPRNPYRYVTLPAGRGTTVAAVERAGGKVRRSRLLSGRFTIPAVAQDGSADGLSADGSTLVLGSPRTPSPRASTQLAVLDVSRGLRVRFVARLRGDYSFDAISPDGRWIYLIRYLSRSDFSDYEVRAYDVRARRLDPKPIVDPHAPADQMRGYPITRATSPDSRWAYTLYDGADGMPFIHALDTVGRAATCIDLEMLMGFPDLYTLRLSVSGSGREIRVLDGSRPVTLVQAGTWRVSEPSAQPSARSTARLPDAGGPSSRAVIAAPALALALATACLAVVGRRRRRPAMN